MNRNDALPIAQAIKDYLQPFCVRVEIAGSIRRLKDDVHDIELVAQPIMTKSFDLFGQENAEISMLNNRSILEQLGNILKAGQRYVQIALNENINLDLFIVLPPAQWGVILAIRTGPADFSRWIVTNRSKGGALPNGWKIAEGRVLSGNLTDELFFPEENAFLKWLDLGWIPPEKRQPKWNYFPKTYR